MKRLVALLSGEIQRTRGNTFGARGRIFVGGILFLLGLTPWMWDQCLGSRALFMESGAGGQILREGSAAPCQGSCDLRVPAFSHVKLKAEPLKGFRFQAWGRACTAQGEDSSCVLTMDTGKIAEARFTQTHTLTIAPGESQLGLEQLMAGDVDCRQGCTLTRDSGTEVHLRAMPASGFRWDHWEGACTGQGLECHFRLDADAALKAHVVPVGKLDLQIEGKGTVTDLNGRQLEGPQTYDLGAAITWVAHPDRGYRFGGWSGACIGQGRCETQAGDDRRVVVASFLENPHFQLVVKPPTQGHVVSEPSGIDCGAGTHACSASFSSVTLRAEARPGFRFKAWSGCDAGGSPLCEITLTQNKTIEARFQKAPLQTLALAVEGAGSVSLMGKKVACPQGSSPCALTLEGSAPWLLEATPDPGHDFVGWEGACPGVDPLCHLRGEGAMAVRARFH